MRLVEMKRSAMSLAEPAATHMDQCAVPDDPSFTVRSAEAEPAEGGVQVRAEARRDVIGVWKAEIAVVDAQGRTIVSAVEKAYSARDALTAAEGAFYRLLIADVDRKRPDDFVDWSIRGAAVADHARANAP